MEVTVLSMSQASQYIPQRNSAIVRISDGGYSLNELNHPYDYVLSMSFYDTTPRVGLPSNWNWFNMSGGKVLLEFFDKIKDCNELVVHCHAGVSRSPAVALAYGWYAKDDSLVEKIKNGEYLPNKQVLEIMSRLIFNDRKMTRSKLTEIEKFFKDKVAKSDKIIKF